MTATDADTIARLRAAVAAGPTPGEWKAKGSEVWIGQRRICPRVSAGEQLGMQDSVDREHANAAFIAAANPSAIQSLLALLDAQAVEVAGLKADAERYQALKRERPVLLLTGFFGNGCVNRELAEVDAILDAARAALTPEGR